MYDRSQPPEIGSCLIWGAVGTVVFSIVIYGSIAFGLPLLGKVFADVFLFVPERLGVVDRIKSHEKIKLGIPGDYEIELNREGAYNIYTEGERLTYQISLRSKTSGQQIRLDPVARFDPFRSDTHYSLGPPYIPIYEFQVEQAGTFIISASLWDEPSDTLTIAPNIPPNSDLALIASVMLQSAIIVAVARMVYYQRHQDDIRAAAAAKQEKSDKFEAWMDGSRED